MRHAVHSSENTSCIAAASFLFCLYCENVSVMYSASKLCGSQSVVIWSAGINTCRWLDLCATLSLPPFLPRCHCRLSGLGAPPLTFLLTGTVAWLYQTVQCVHVCQQDSIFACSLCVCLILGQSVEVVAESERNIPKAVAVGKGRFSCTGNKHTIWVLLLNCRT